MRIFLKPGQTPKRMNPWNSIELKNIKWMRKHFYFINTKPISVTDFRKEVDKYIYPFIPICFALKKKKKKKKLVQFFVYSYFLMYCRWKWNLDVRPWNVLFQLDYPVQNRNCNISIISSAASLETVKPAVCFISDMEKKKKKWSRSTLLKTSWTHLFFNVSAP